MRLFLRYVNMAVEELSVFKIIFPRKALIMFLRKAICSLFLILSFTITQFATAQSSSKSNPVTLELVEQLAGQDKSVTDKSAGRVLVRFTATDNKKIPLDGKVGYFVRHKGRQRRIMGNGDPALRFFRVDNDIVLDFNMAYLEQKFGETAVGVYFEGYVPFITKRIQIDPGQLIDLGTVKIAPGKPTVVTVKAPDNTTVSDASVSAEYFTDSMSLDFMPRALNDDGSITIYLPDEAKMRFIVRSDKFKYYQKNLHVNGGEDIVLRLIANVSINGTVVSKSTGKPITNAKITDLLSRQSTMTDQFGKFSGLNASANSTRLVVQAENYRPMILFSNTNGEPLHIKLDDPINFHGRFINIPDTLSSADGNVKIPYKLYFEDESKFFREYSEGVVQCQVVNGEAKFFLKDACKGMIAFFPGSTEKVSLIKDGAKPVDIDLDPQNKLLVPTRTKKIFIQLLPPSPGMPMPEGKLLTKFEITECEVIKNQVWYIHQEGGGSRFIETESEVDENGLVAVVVPVPTDLYISSGKLENYMLPQAPFPRSQNHLQVHEGTEYGPANPITVKLNQTGSINVVATDYNGKPMPWLSVSLYPDGDRHHLGNRNNEMNTVFAFKGVSFDSNYSVTLKQNRALKIVGPIRVSKNNPASSLQVKMDKKINQAVRLLESRGKPLQGYRVKLSFELFGRSITIDDGVTDNSGEYTYRGIIENPHQNGKYYITITDNDFKTNWGIRVQLIPDANKVMEIRLKRTGEYHINYTP